MDAGSTMELRSARGRVLPEYLRTLRECRRSPSWGRLRHLDCSLALANLHPNHLVQSDKQPGGVIAPVYVSLERELSVGDFWLAAAANGSISIYDRVSLSEAALQCRKAVTGRPPFPLGYVPTSEEETVRNLRPSQSLIPAGHFNLLHEAAKAEEEKVVARAGRENRQATGAPVSLGVTSVRWLPNDSRGVVSSEANGTVTLWDVKVGSHRSGGRSRTVGQPAAVQALLRVRCAKSVLRLEAPQSRSSILSAPTSDSNREGAVFILCCDDALHPLKVLDFRVGNVVAGFGSNLSLGASGRVATQATRSPAQRNLVAVAFGDRVLSLWDIRNATRPLSYCLDTSRLREIDGSAVQAQPDEPRKSRNTTLRPCHSSVITDLIFTADGGHLISASLLGGRSLKRALAHNDHLQLWHVPTASRVAVQFDAECLTPDLPDLKPQCRGRNLQTSVMLVDGGGIADSYLTCGVGSQVAAYNLGNGRVVSTAQCDIHLKANILHVISAPSPPSFLLNDPSHGLVSADDKGNLVLWRADDHTLIDEPLLSSEDWQRARDRASVRPLVYH